MPKPDHSSGRRHSRQPRFDAPPVPPPIPLEQPSTPAKGGEVFRPFHDQGLMEKKYPALKNKDFDAVYDLSKSKILKVILKMLNLNKRLQTHICSY